MGIQVEGVGHVVLKVSDVERSLTFYRAARSETPTFVPKRGQA